MMVSMRTTVIALGVLMSAATLAAQNTDSPEAHIARAKTAAANDYQNLFNFLCTVPRAGSPPPPRATADKPAVSAGRPVWYTEPAKVFDNLYFVGQTEYSAWAVITSEGIILIDTL